MYFCCLLTSTCVYRLLDIYLSRYTNVLYVLQKIMHAECQKQLKTTAMLFVTADTQQLQGCDLQNLCDD